MRVSLRLALAILISITVFIVSISALLITYSFSLKALRHVGHDQALSVHVHATETFSNYVNAPLEHLRLLQKKVMRSGSAAEAAAVLGQTSPYILPTESTAPTLWHTPWQDMMENVALLSNFSYSQVLFLFEDNALCRYLNVDDGRRANLYCSRPAASDPLNASAVEEHTEQFYTSNLSTPQTLFRAPYKKLLASSINSWSTARNLLTNKPMGFYYSEFFVGSFPQDFILPLFGGLHNTTGHYLGSVGVINGIRPLTTFLKGIDRSPNTQIFVIDNWGAVAATTYEDAPWFEMKFPHDMNYSEPLPGPWCRRSIPGAPNVEACRFFAKDLPYAPLQAAMRDTRLVEPVPGTEYDIRVRSNTEGSIELRDKDVDGSRYYITAAPNPTLEGVKVEDMSSIHFYTILVMPEEDIIGDVVKGRNVAIITTVGIFVIMVAVACALVHAMLRTLSTLAAKMDDTSRLRDGALKDEEQMESHLTEIDDLCTAYHRMAIKLEAVKSFVPQNIMENDEKPSMKLPIPTANTSGSMADPLYSEGDSHSVSISRSQPPRQHGSISSNVTGNYNPLLVSGDGYHHHPTAAHFLDGPIPGPHPTGSGSSKACFSVNERSLATENNQFALRRVTAVAIEWPSLPTGDPVTLGTHVAKHLNRIVKKAIDAGGVIETMSPDYMLVTFNSHFSCLMHEERAVSFAMRITKHLHKDAFVAVDTSDCAVGTVGAHGRRSRVVLGECIDTVRKLTELIRTYVTSKLIVTERCARGVSNHTFSFVDILCPKWYQNDRARLIYVAIPSGIDLFTNTSGLVFTTAHKTAFSALMRGNVAEAATTWRTMDNWQSDAHLVRLVSSCEALLATGALPQYRRLEQPSSWDSLGNNVWYQYVDRGSGSASGDVHPNSAVAKIVNMMRGTEEEESVVGTSDENLAPLVGLIGSTNSPHVTPNSSATGGLLPNRHNIIDIKKVVTDLEGTEWTRADQPLAKGSYGDVYQGLSSSGAICAIKVIRTNTRTFDMADLKSEVSLLCTVHHPNIVHYVSVATDGHRAVFLLMELVSGGSLKDVLGRFGGLPQSIVRRYTIDVLKGLAYLHEQQIVHCDIKPHNILLSVDGVVKLADFGSAVNKLSNTAAVQPSVDSIRGTVWYMAPEVANGNDPTTASDMWSLGITLLELLTGHLPWTAEQRNGNNQALFMRSLGISSRQDQPPMLPIIPSEDDGAIPADIRRLILRCLQRDPQARPSCMEVLESEFSL